MAKIFCSKKLVVVTASTAVFFFGFEYHNNELNLIFEKAITIECYPKHSSDTQNWSDACCTTKNENSVGKEEKVDDRDKSLIHLDNQILGGSFSADGALFAVITTSKTCFIYCTKDNWSLKLAQFNLPKTPTSVTFDKSSEYVIVADRTGNVTRYRVDVKVSDSLQKPGELLLGHCSMVLSVTMSSSGKYICSSDRDEKIRISRYPESFIICQYCLGHTSYVNSIAVIYDMIFSSGGDGNIKVWRINDGHEICSCDTFKRKRIRTLKIDMNCSANDRIKLAILVEDSRNIEMIMYDVLKVKFVRIAELTAQDEIMDIEFMIGRGLVAVTRKDIWFYSGKNGDALKPLEIMVPELSSALAKANDVPLMLEKKLGFNNLQDYQRRKAERLSKRKRKHELSGTSL